MTTTPNAAAVNAESAAKLAEEILDAYFEHYDIYDGRHGQAAHHLRDCICDLIERHATPQVNVESANYKTEKPMNTEIMENEQRAAKLSARIQPGLERDNLGFAHQTLVDIAASDKTAFQSPALEVDYLRELARKAVAFIETGRL